MVCGVPPWGETMRRQGAVVVIIFILCDGSLGGNLIDWAEEIEVGVV